MASLRASSTRVCACSLVTLWVGCANNPEPRKQNASPASESDAGEVNPGANGSDSDSNASTSSGTGASGEGMGAGASTGNEVPRPATPAEACGTDLDADNGQVLPALGTVPKGKVFQGDPLDAGPFKVLTSKHAVPNPDPMWNDVALTIYAPSSDGRTLADGKHALVMVMPGFGKGLGLTLSGLHPSYAFYSEHLASHGFIVVGMNFVAGGIGLPFVTTENLGAHFLTQQTKNVAEVKAVLDFALSASPVKSQIDDSKIAIAGHSQGGKVAFFAAVEDARFDLVIGWDPQNAAGGTPCAGAPDTCNLLPIAPICPDPADPAKANPGRLHELHAETLVFAARDSGSIPDTHQFAENFYRGAPSPAHLLLFKDASHENWSDGNNPVAKTTMRAQLALLLTRFQGVTGLEGYLPGADKLVEGVARVEQHNK